MHLPGIGPRRESGDDVELSQKPADDFVGICFGAQPIELRHDLHEGLLHVSNGVLRVVLTLLVETALALDKLLAIELLYGVNHRLGQARVREVTRQQALPQRGHTLNR